MAGYAQPTKTAIEKDAAIAGQCSEKQNFAGTGVSDWHKSDTTETRFVPVDDDAAKENAAADAPRNGVNDFGKRDVSPANNTPNKAISSREIAMLQNGYGDDIVNRVQTAIDALADLEPWQVEMVAASNLRAAGSPLPEFLGGMNGRCAVLDQLGDA